MANRRYNQFFNTLHKMPVLLDCNFTVDATNAAGITGLKGAGVDAVWMHTSTTPVSGSPNPASGLIYVKLQDNYNFLYMNSSSIQSPVTGANINISGAAVLTIGQAYIITAVGTSTTANWIAAGLPYGVTPAVGVSFIAGITGLGTGTGTVKAVGVSGISAIEVVGNSNLTITSNALNIPNVAGPKSGPYIILQTLAATAAGNTALIPTAPAAGSLIRLSMYLSNSQILVQGE